MAKGFIHLPGKGEMTGLMPERENIQGVILKISLAMESLAWVGEER